MYPVTHPNLVGIPPLVSVRCKGAHASKHFYEGSLHFIGFFFPLVRGQAYPPPCKPVSAEEAMPAVYDIRKSGRWTNNYHCNQSERSENVTQTAIFQRKEIIRVSSGGLKSPGKGTEPRKIENPQGTVVTNYNSTRPTASTPQVRTSRCVRIDRVEERTTFCN